MKSTVKVWDPLVRLFHWSLVTCFAVAWLSADEWQDLHEVMGYTIMGLLAVRIIWGLVGPRYARFRHFLQSPAKVLDYLNDIRRGREARHIGHNPAGGVMVLALILGLALLTFTGWLYTTDRFWGEDWVEELHEFLANGLLMLVGLHLAGIALASLRHRESLIKAMLTGRKRAPSDKDVA